MSNLQAGLRSLLLLPLFACGDRLVGWPIPDEEPPTVLWTTPADGATGVALNATVLATFSEAMDPLTLTAGTLTLRDGASEVLGALSTVGTEGLLFTTREALERRTMYTATITTAARDLAGNALRQDYVWTFKTGASLVDTGGTETGEPDTDDRDTSDTDTDEPDWALEPVDLGTLRRFVAVAGAGLTNSNSGGVTLLSGDVGLFPTATCLGDGVPCTASNPVINGTLFAADPEGVAARAKADLVDAYADAMSRPVGVTVSDLSGMTLPPGVYTSGSTMSVAVDGVVTLDGEGDENAVWIFQIGSSLTVNNKARLELINGASAANVYWAAFASTTLGSNVVFQGNILAGASNSVGTGSVVVGRLLCTDGTITLLSNSITLPAL